MPAKRSKPRELAEVLLQIMGRECNAAYAPAVVVCELALPYVGAPEVARALRRLRARGSARS